MSDQAWVVYDHDYGPFAISRHRTAEEAARSAAQAGYGRVAKWEFEVDFKDAIRAWEAGL